MFFNCVYIQKLLYWFHISCFVSNQFKSNPNRLFSFEFQTSSSARVIYSKLFPQSGYFPIIRTVIIENQKQNRSFSAFIANSVYSKTIHSVSFNKIENRASRNDKMSSKGDSSSKDVAGANEKPVCDSNNIQIEPNLIRKYLNK